MPRARYDAERRRLGFTLARRADRSGVATIALANVFGRGAWTLAADGAVIARGDARDVAGGAATPTRRVGDRLEIAPEVEAVSRFEIVWDGARV